VVAASVTVGVMSDAEADALRAELVPAYVDYCWNVSRRSMALSLETAVLLWQVCRAAGAASVADFGSGFSSYVLRRYAAETGGVTVTSVDDNAVWLARTAEFAGRHGVGGGEFVLWADYQASPGGPHDVVLHDLAGGKVREAAMAFVAGRVRPGGHVVFDDAQHDGHRASMVALGDRFEWVDVRKRTEDQIGRYAMLGVVR
jgi:predicted O-methyltransferase YrrM